MPDAVVVSFFRRASIHPTQNPTAPTGAKRRLHENPSDEGDRWMTGGAWATGPASTNGIATDADGAGVGRTSLDALATGATTGASSTTTRKPLSAFRVPGVFR